jgi:hypothetical protein
VQITRAERVTRLLKSAFPTAFFKSKIGEGNAARRSSADAAAKAARAALCVRSAGQAASATVYRRGSLRVLLLCSWDGFTVCGSDLAEFTPICACAVSGSRINPQR